MQTPIQILNNLLLDNMTIAEPILEEISVDLIKYIQYFYVIEVPEVKDLKKLQMHVTPLLLMIKNELKCVWGALGSLLSEETRNISQEY